jgi:hypothetical protein
MKRYHSFGKSALTALFVTILIGATLGCSDDLSEDDPILQSIAITSQPDKIVYVQGEALAIDGLVVTVTYSDGKIEMEPVSASNVSGYDPDTTGTQTLTVTLNGKTTTFTVTVNASDTPQSIAVLQSIAITGPPTKIEYTQGEALDIGGLEVTGNYSDGTSKQETVIMSNVSGYNANTPGTQTVTVTVGGKTATFTVTVNPSAAVLQNIAITSQPNKTVYTQGEAFAIDGLEVTGTYSDGTSKQETVIMSNVHGYNANEPGTQTVTVTVGGYTDTFSVTVNASDTPQSIAVLQSIVITNPPTKIVYVQGEAFAIGGLEVTGNYTDGTSKTETVIMSNISGYDPNLVDQQDLIVTVGGYTATFSVTVSPTAAVLQSIAITSPPTKTVYTQGEAFAIGGLEVTGTYTDGTSKLETVITSNVRGYNANMTGTQTVTVMVGGYTATFSVTVNAGDTPQSIAVLQSIVITGPPNKTDYTQGEALDIDGLVVTGTYTDGTSKPETVITSNVRGYDPNLVGQQDLIVTVGGETATFTVTVNPTAAVLQSIAITSPPTKTVYVKGEALDLSGLEVTGTYTNGTTKTETVIMSNISWYDPNLVGQQDLTVTVGGKTDTFTVTVNPIAAVLQSIAITSPPTKTVYVQGEALDLSGLEVTGTYTNGTTKTETVIMSNVHGYNANATGQQTVTVTVGGKTTTFTVTVSPPAAVLQSIAITGPPAKTVYVQGEALDLSGLVVTGTYSDGSKKQETVIMSNVHGYNANTTGQQTVTVTVGGKTATFTVTVNNRVLQSIAITGLPAKTVYVQGEPLDISGLVVTVTYTNGTKEEETVSVSNISGYDPNLVGQQTLLVTVGAYTATFTVTVNPTAALSMRLDDPLLDDLVGGIVLSKSGMPASLSLEIVGAYASYRWLLNDSNTPVSITPSCVLNAADCPLGGNSLLVEVRTSAGAYYSREITFIVNR